MQVGRRGGDARPVEPQVRVWRRRVIPEAVAGGSLRALQALLVVHAAEVVAVDGGHVRGLLGAFGGERADVRGGVVLVLVMGLRVDGVHHSPREIPEGNAEAVQVASPGGAQAAATSVREDGGLWGVLMA